MVTVYKPIFKNAFKTVQKRVKKNRKNGSPKILMELQNCSFIQLTEKQRAEIKNT